MNNDKMATLVLVANLKGGVGKSTISSILASKFAQKQNLKTCIFNMAKGQSAETINEAETIDYSTLLSIDDAITASQAIADLMQNYDYVFIDTAGDLSDELVEIINYVNYFVIPFDRGNRVFEDTITYIESIFLSGVIEHSNTHNVSLVSNKFKYKKNKYKSIEEQLDEQKNQYFSKMNSIASNNGISFDLNFTYLSDSDVVETMEEKKASIDTLAGTNAAAYRIFNFKAEEMCDSVAKHMTEAIAE